MKNESFKTIGEYFEHAKKFIIPNYQRGFKWGVPHGKNGECSISILMDDLIKAQKKNVKEYFLQGVTVSEEKGKVTLIDGQQRTIALFLLLSYLKSKMGNSDLYSKIEKLIPKEKIFYLIRAQSNDFLNNKLNDFSGKNKLDEDEGIQDIYYFKKALITMNSKLNNVDFTGFAGFLLNNVKIIYICISNDKAVKAFSMLNGQKAMMTDVELIKAKLLSKASRNNQNNNEKEDVEWEVNSLRSRYAREWDKWLYWWKQEEVQSIFKNKGKNPMQLLLDVFYLKETKKEEKNKTIPEGKNKEFFKAFEGELLKSKTDAKKNFLKLRKLQKTFEDLFNDYESYNALGLIFNAGNYGKRKEHFIIEIINSDKDLFDYAKWCIADVTYTEYKKIGKQDNTEKEAIRKVNELFDNLSQKDIYNTDAKENANRQLLRMNVELDNNLQRKFNFTIYNNRSLEHIHAKSKDAELEEFKEFNKGGSKFSVHCIGNLALLDKNDNSKFNASEFQHKKDILFDFKELRPSLTLLHTLGIFSKAKWTEKEIKINYHDTLINIADAYNLQPERNDLEIKRNSISEEEN